MDANWGWILAGLAAMSSVFYAARNAMQSAWRSVESLVIVSLQVRQIDLPAWVIYRWLCKNGRLLHSPQCRFSTERVRVTNQFLAEHDWADRARNGDQCVRALFDAVPLPSVWLVHGWKLVFLTIDKGGSPVDGHNHSRSGVNAYVDVLLTTGRGCFNLAELAKELLEWEDRWGGELQARSRFSVSYLTGNAASLRHHGGRTETQSSDNPDAHKAVMGRAQEAFANRDIREGSQGTRIFDELGIVPYNVKSSDLVQGLPYGSRLEDLALCPEADTMFQELKHWKNGRMWFADRGVPWKRGYGLIGPPGNGKTSTIRAMAAELGLPIFLVDLTSFTNSELASTWRSTVLQYAPCLIVLEDLDRVFRGDKPQPGMYLSYDCLLNILDGMEQADGVCVFVTSNKPEQLDEAIMKRLEDGTIVTRPGRIDSVVEFKNPSMTGKVKIAERILQGMDRESIEDLVEDGVNDTGAEFQQRCFKVAESLFWKNYVEPEDEKRDGGEVGRASR